MKSLQTVNDTGTWLTKWPAGHTHRYQTRNKCDSNDKHRTLTSPTNMARAIQCQEVTKAFRRIVCQKVVSEISKGEYENKSNIRSSFFCVRDLQPPQTLKISYVCTFTLITVYYHRHYGSHTFEFGGCNSAPEQYAYLWHQTAQRSLPSSD